MAKSFDKKNIIDDDLIRQALKTRLKSIQPSDELIKRTIEKCSIEHEKVIEKDKKISFIPWIYKLGAPVAAGALILTLMLNTGNLFTKYSTQSEVPSDSNFEAAAPSDVPQIAGSSELTVSDEKLRSASPEYKLGEPDVSEEPMYKGEVRGFGSMTLMAPAVERLNSLANASQTSVMFTANNEYADAFNYLVSQYNSDMETIYVLDESKATLVHAVQDNGVDASTLLAAESYRDILNNEGYWVLPLKNEDDVTDRLLAVNIIDSTDREMTISSNDITYEYQQKSFLVTPIFRSFDDIQIIFDKMSLTEHVQASGYKEVSDPVIADINNGNDFIAFMEADNQEIAVPLFTNNGLFGLENNRVYNRDELFKIISGYLE